MTSKNPTNSSVLAREPMQVIEVPDKEVILVETETENCCKEKVTKDTTNSSDKIKNKLEIDMDVTMSEEIPANNET